MHGPAELLPISSSGHVALIPWLAGWPEAELEPELRKSLEVALHAGTAAALVIGLRREVLDAVRAIDARGVELLAGSFVVPAMVGYALERPIERHLGTPATIAAGLLVGGGAMALADLWGGGRDGGRSVLGRSGRLRGQAGAVDGLLLGAAQACALIPGVSRNGATLAVARARGFDRRDADLLSRHVALPVIVGATGLKGLRLWRRGLDRDARRALGAGAAAAFASTLASTWLVRQLGRDRSLAPYALYRALLAGVVVRRLRENARVTTRPADHAPARGAGSHSGSPR